MYVNFRLAEDEAFLGMNDPEVDIYKLSLIINRRRLALILNVIHI